MPRSTIKNRRHKIDYKLVQRLAALGLTDKEIAVALEIPNSTFEAYIPQDPQLQKALQKGKLSPNRKVEQALFKRARGYDYEEVDVKELPDGRRETIRRRRHLPPDVKAIEIWLRNRMPERWNTPQNFNVNMSLRDMAELFHRARGEGRG